MKKNFTAGAFSLIELIVAMALVSIIGLGIVSINVAMFNSNTDFGQRYSVKSQTQSTLNHILNNAALGVGSANPNDEAVLIGAQLTDHDPNSFCIHQAGTGDTPPGQNLAGSAADIWLCYSWVNTAGNPYQIEWCAEAYPAAAVTNPGSVADPRGASSCPAAGGGTFVGSAFSMAPSFALSPLQFSMTLDNCLSDSLASCNGGGPGISSDLSNNPEVQISGSVIPLQASGD